MRPTLKHKMAPVNVVHGKGKTMKKFFYRFVCVLVIWIGGCAERDPYKDAGLEAVGEYKNSLGMDFVKMPGGYYVSKYETRQSEFEKIMGYNKSKGIGPDLPVELLTADEAKDFCQKLSEYEKVKGTLPDGFVYTLPSYREWLEYVADAPLEGSHSLVGHGTEQADPTLGTTVNVDADNCNRLGLFHIRGNVSEFSRDISGSTKTNLILGASYYQNSSYRTIPTHKCSFMKTYNKSLDVGFRVVLILETKNVISVRQHGINPND